MGLILGGVPHGGRAEERLVPLQRQGFCESLVDAVGMEFKGGRTRTISPFTAAPVFVTESGIGQGLDNISQLPSPFVFGTQRCLPNTN